MRIDNDLPNAEFAEVDDIIDEARHKFNEDSQITRFIFEQLSNLGYLPEDIVEILSYAGY